MDSRTSPTPDPGLAARCEAIELLVLDVDGVLTDGSIAYDDRGGEIKTFSVRDGAGLACWHRLGKRSAILTGRSSPIVERRASELGMVLVRQGIAEKGPELRSILESLGCRSDQTCVMGDDLPDLPALKIAGLAACPGDAAAEVRSVSHLVTKAAGGRGAVREVVETILRAQGLWAGLVDQIGGVA